MAEDVVRLAVEDGIARLTLCRPQARNGLTPEVAEGLLAGLGSPEVAGAEAVVLAGEGGTFCAGADLDYVRRAQESGTVALALRPILEALHASVRALRALPVPVIAAVEGAAAGAGAGLALAADLRVFGQSAVLVPAYLAIGAPPDGGTSYHLVRGLGGPRALAAFVRNRRLPAAELAACGLADEVAPDGRVLAAALRLAGEVAGTAPLALLALRRLVDAAPTHGLDAHLDAEGAAMESLWDTADFVEGVTAFLERRRPRFAGR